MSCFYSIDTAILSANFEPPIIKDIKFEFINFTYYKYHIFTGTHYRAGPRDRDPERAAGGQDQAWIN